MNSIREWLKGKKTYLVGVGAVLAAVIAWAGGEVEIGGAIQAIITAVLAMTVRAGVSTETE